MWATNILSTQFSLLQFCSSAGEKVDYETESRAAKSWLSHFLLRPSACDTQILSLSSVSLLM